MDEIISLRVDKDLREKMRNHDEINWSAVLRKAIEKKVRELIEIEKLRKRLDSEEEKELERWSVELGRKAKKDSFKKLLSELHPEKKNKLLDLMPPEKRKEYE